jgi:type IV conjugative transfer system protein TraL
MEGDPDCHIINDIKDPWKLLVLDMDIFMGVAPILFVSFTMQHEMIGALIAGLIAWKWQTFRNTNPRGAGIRWLWWHLPTQIWFMTKNVTPPSDKREFIG